VAVRRLPVSLVVLATVFALVAAVAVALVLRDDTSPAGEDAGAEMELTPAGELPESTADVQLVALDGGADRTVGELAGTPLVLNFFASWCAPCIEEMPAFEQVHQSLGGQVTIVGVAYRDAPADALDTVERTGVTYAAYSDPEGSALTYFGGLSMPATVFIDAAGEVVEVHSGALTEQELRDNLQTHLGVGP
jgi:cytochrome c biogenesis protein CcmG, thiol:disulfide interchange protein DsbE